MLLTNHKKSPSKIYPFKKLQVLNSHFFEIDDLLNENWANKRQREFFLTPIVLYHVTMSVDQNFAVKNWVFLDFIILLEQSEHEIQPASWRAQLVDNIAIYRKFISKQVLNIVLRECSIYTVFVIKLYVYFTL